MANDRVKIVGYSQRTFYNNGIEYRNFTDDLVGNQQVESDNENTSLFTMGNFVVTTNLSGKLNRDYNTKKFSNFYCLESLDLTSESAAILLNNNALVTLNLDNTELCNYAYFGSATEFIRVSLENIITNWPASLYVTPLRESNLYTVTGNTVQNYVFDAYLNKATFRVPVEQLTNNFEIVYEENGTTINLFNEVNNMRNLTVNYTDYVVMSDTGEYPILKYTGSTTKSSGYIYLETEGNPFSAITNQFVYYHIKPKALKVDQFFNTLSPFENNLLNRLVTPKYTSEYNYQIQNDEGIIVNKSRNLTWPVSDGYNIDFNTTNYAEYVTRLLEITTAKDLIDSNLMVRFLTSDSISEFDTIAKCDGSEEETAGQKMNKTLKIYGREFDEVKKWIDGIAYSNTVTYDKKNNTPDQVVKYLARTLGWELTQSVVENNLLKAYVETPASTYSGQSRGLSVNEAETELWRRLILNSAWIWKSKGTRKAIEFLFKFIGAPQGLIDLDEYIYVAKEPIDMDLFNLILETLGLSSDLNKYLVDSDGYPRFFNDNSKMYFQKAGGWYRETGGSGATEYILDGNNPHVGPYDNGYEYISQLEKIIPNFQPIVLTSTTVSTGTTDLFTNYNDGIINGYSGETYVDIQGISGVNLDACYLITSSIIDDPKPTAEMTDCGCDLEENDDALITYVERIPQTLLETAQDCKDNIPLYNVALDYNNPNYGNFPYVEIIGYAQYNPDGTLIPGLSYESVFYSPNCCQAVLGSGAITHISYEYDEYNITSYVDDKGITQYNTTLTNCGYVCCAEVEEQSCGCFITCKWRLAGPTLGEMYNIGQDGYYLKFATPKNNWGTSGPAEYKIISEPDGCFCPLTWTTPVQISDPINPNKFGTACMLNAEGITMMTPDGTTNGTSDSPIYKYYFQKSIGSIDCSADERDFIIPTFDCNDLVVSFQEFPIEYTSELNINTRRIRPLIITGGEPPYTFKWRMSSRTGFFTNWVFEGGNLPSQISITTIDSYPLIINPSGINPGSGGSLICADAFSLVVTVTDANGCERMVSEECITDIIA